MAKTTVTLWLRVERNNKFVRGKQRVRSDIESLLARRYGMKRLDRGAYELTIEYDDPPQGLGLDVEVDELIQEMAFLADLRNCFIETDVRENGTDRYW
ncbi:hypothetical protein [Azospirillum sp.]|uniref:hypothetical protein n=1 Tax=Azospirillum sp. TaxID=34012 RepID=UPI002D2593C5|nr:hypothetical protein [Azospirillum sp.]HYD63934.1 hypothetical protein [Azospirillum sp.]